MKTKALLSALAIVFTTVNFVLHIQANENPFLMELIDLDIAGSNGLPVDNCLSQSWDYVIISDEGCIVTLDNIGLCWEIPSIGDCFSGTNHIVQDVCENETLVNTWMGTYYSCDLD